MSVKVFGSVFLVMLLSLGSVSLVQNFSEEERYSNNTLSNYSESFYKATSAYDSIAQRFVKGKATIEKLRKYHLDTRKAFKRIEFYADFKYHEFVQEHINGAPLHKVKSVKNRAEVVAPEGLQILDELVFEDDLRDNPSELVPLTKRLKFSAERLHKRLSQDKILDAELVVASQVELIRIFTLSLSGFDTPGSLNALPESKIALESLREFFKASDLRNKKQFIDGFSKALIYFSDTNNFDDFNRLEFLREAINPLYQDLASADIDTSEVSELLSKLPINLKANSMFSDNFLDAYAYTDLKQEEDSESIQQLGKTLFYDDILSENNTISCANCHNPNLAFTDGLKVPEQPINGIAFTRNTPTLLNAVYANRYFYDLRAFNLEQQAEHVIFNANEFNTTYEQILKRLNADANYPQQFKTAFGSADVSREDVLKALSSYVLSLRSFNSEFDVYARGESLDLSEDAKKGFNIFMGKGACATCHFPPTFAGLVPPNFKDSESEVLGVLIAPDSLQLDTDKGRIANGIHTEEAWMFDNAFKTTTVRNIAGTAPYFHNGAYETLEDVIDFYNDGGGAGKGIDVDNQTLSDAPLNLNENEKLQLIAFLKSLTDNPFTEN